MSSQHTQGVHCVAIHKYKTVRLGALQSPGYRLYIARLTRAAGICEHAGGKEKEKVKDKLRPEA